jgi:hypothetical protein
MGATDQERKEVQEMANRFEILELQRLSKEIAYQDIIIRLMGGMTTEDLTKYLKEELSKSQESAKQEAGQ